jgi:hypothetical protein
MYQQPAPVAIRVRCPQRLSGMSQATLVLYVSPIFAPKIYCQNNRLSDLVQYFNVTNAVWHVTILPQPYKA